MARGRRGMKLKDLGRTTTNIGGSLLNSVDQVAYGLETGINSVTDSIEEWADERQVAQSIRKANWADRKKTIEFQTLEDISMEYLDKANELKADIEYKEMILKETFDDDKVAELMKKSYERLNSLLALI